MSTIKAFLDTRKSGSDPTKAASLKLAIAHRKSTAYIVLNITLLPTQWNSATREVVRHPQSKFLNTLLRKKVCEAEAAIATLTNQEDINALTATELRAKVFEIIMPAKAEEQRVKAKAEEEDETTLVRVFERCMETKNRTNRKLFHTTLNRIRAFVPAEELAKMHFEDINIEWLRKFEIFLTSTAPSANGRAIHLRNLRTVCNFAIDMEITQKYPFRRFKIKTQKTRKRNFDVETLRRIFNHQCEEEWQQKYLDFFKLTFMLIGINVVDLCGLQRISNGYATYQRAKTHKEYAIKVESEAYALIDKYRGKGKLLNFDENYVFYRSFYQRLSVGLRAIKKQLGVDELTTYWARHSWATIAASIDIPKDTIAQALGHGDNSVTDIYIERHQNKVDEANRKVLDWVLYGKL